MSTAPSPGLRWNWPRVGVFVAAVLVVVVLLLALVAALLQRGEARPGTRLDGVDVGGLSRAELVAVAEDVAASRRARTVTFRAGDVSVDVRARRLGLRVDAEATADAALDARRGGALGLLHGLTAWFGAGHDVAPVGTLRERRLTNQVDTLVTELGREVEHGGFTVSATGDEVDVVVVPPHPGVALDRDEVTATVRDALVAGRSELVELPADVDEPEADAAAADEVADRAHDLLSEPFVLADDRRELTLDPSTLGPLLHAVPDGDGGLEVAVDETGLREAVEDAAAPLTDDPRPPRLRSPYPAVRLTAQGDATFKARSISTSVRKGRPGFGVDVDAAVAEIATAVAEGRRSGRLPTTELPVPDTDLDLASVDQVIGSFTTYFPCCAPRARNIARMAELVDGAVVAPGETFSLNATAGERTLERGFFEDGAIVDGELEMQVGGGVSQFSTTMLNAVWFAGLPVVEHQPHSVYISRYPPGREATLNWGSIDNRWRNDTEHPVVVRSAATAGSVTVSLYGHTGRRTTSSTTGPREPRDGGGFRVAVNRTVTDAGEVVREDALAWTYRPPLGSDDEKKKKEEKAKKDKKKKDRKKQQEKKDEPATGSSSPSATASTSASTRRPSAR